ncbi:hypothetical protein [Pseudomonas sp. MWU12-2323]|uniref:hypothetical protein n=1 Tax=Pseudomonas sp. MWU12-2323 TaxID=2651296 RepID=UPI00128C479C|nr:hypothetical protein [Pseudomonas sp. MWU12-2323]MPQ71519.1 hypothetical protein [Pseudomonas sp. MWU12-2323]
MANHVSLIPVTNLAGVEGKGKSPIVDAHEQAQALMIDYQTLITRALPNDAEGYELAYASALMDQKNVCIAVNQKEHIVYVFSSHDARPDMQDLAMWLLDMAKHLTDVLQTFVVPDQGTNFDYWGQSQLGLDVLGYKFKMADTPTSIMPAGNALK